MEHAPPPFFRTGPTPLVRLLLFIALSLALLVADQRLNYLDLLRQFTSLIVYPAQRIAGAPSSIFERASEFFVTNSSLRTDNARLERENLEHSALLQQLGSLEAENEHLRKLLKTRERLKSRTTLAEILYAARDPFSLMLVFDQGTSH